MLYPNLSINIKPKRATGLEDTSPVINTPVILDMAVQMSDEKNSFAFNSHQPCINQFRLDQDKHSINNSLQTPIIELNHQNAPFFQNSQATSNDNLNDFVAPNDILNQYTSANSTSTSTTTNTNLNLNNFNDLNLIHQVSVLPDLSDSQNDSHQLNLAQNNKLVQLTKQEQITSVSQNDYQNHFIITTAPSYSNQQLNQQLNQYTSNLLNHQNEQLNDNLPINSHLNQDIHSLTYTELKPSNQQQTLLIPNSVSDINGIYKNKQQQQQQQLQPSTSSAMSNNYHLSPASPAESLSSATSSSNLDNADLFNSNYRGEKSYSSSRAGKLHQIANDRTEKKSRLTKKQKYDAMITEEKDLLKNNDQLKTDIKRLEDLIIHYKQTIMNTVKKSK